jgi:hypothetical protein
MILKSWAAAGIAVAKTFYGSFVRPRWVFQTLFPRRRHQSLAAAEFHAGNDL